eukprot:m.352014 g.352014  ORF g.352014 m.352014 type:complete len:57 (+) comp16420_c0_seq1:607-777(+)
MSWLRLGDSKHAEIFQNTCNNGTKRVDKATQDDQHYALVRWLSKKVASKANIIMEG